jgi:hypothetical protein
LLLPLPLIDAALVDTGYTFAHIAPAVAYLLASAQDP